MLAEANDTIARTAESGLSPGDLFAALPHEGTHMRLTRAEVHKAAMRLAVEELIHIDTIATEMFCTKETVKRYGVEGSRGVHLDIVRRDEKWYTSRPALGRFIREREALDATTAKVPVKSTKNTDLLHDPPLNTEGRTRREILDGIRRVTADRLVPLAILAAEAGESEEEMIAWIGRGVEGHFLDGVFCGKKTGWKSSREATQRFLEDVEGTAATMAAAAEQS
jgi:hypothetical protein